MVYERSCAELEVLPLKRPMLKFEYNGATYKISQAPGVNYL